MRKLKLFLALALAASVCVPTVNVTNVTATETVVINNATELASAIKNQEDGQTWQIAAGTYDLTEELVKTYADLDIMGRKGWVFPITADDLTIIGEGDVTITSSYNPNTGAWHGQNFLTVAGDNVSIENVDLKGNPNTFYGNLCNKVIEVLGTDFKLTDSTLLPLDYTDGTVNSGSIYFNPTNADLDIGDVTFTNVELNSWLSASSSEVSKGTVNLVDSTINFENNAYAGYGYGVISNNSAIKAENLTVKVDGNVDLQEDVFALVPEGTTVQLTEDYTVEDIVLELTPAHSNVTLDLNGHTIKAGENFNPEINPGNNNWRKNLVSITNADGFTIKNGTLTANGNSNVRNILNLQTSNNVVIEDVTLDHTTAGSGAPLIVNGSEAVLEGDVEFVTGTNSWYAVNVDDKYAAAVLNAENANVTFSGDTTKLPVFVSDNGKDTSTVTGLEDLGNGVYGEAAATIGEDKYSSVQLAVDAAKDGETVTVLAGRHEEEVKISNKAIKLVGEEGAELFGVVAVNTTDEELEGLTIENIHFYGASNVVSLDTNASTIYLQGKYKDVVIKDNELILEETLGNAPYTVAITTGAGINGMLVENNVIKNYTISGYHNPVWANTDETSSTNISYVGNTFENILSGVYFGGVDNVTVTGNTFIKSNGVRFQYGSTIADLGENAFVSYPDDTTYGRYAVRFYDGGVEGEADLSDNYWGVEDIQTVITNEDTDFDYTLDTYYVSADMTDKNTDTDVFELDSLEVELQEGAKLTVKATAKDHDGNPVPITWTSKDESVATVKDGVITAVKEGETVIVADANGVTREIKVTVTKAGGNVPTDPDTDTEDKPTETPNTSDMSLLGCYGMMAVLSLAILVVLNKKRALSK